MKLASMDTQVDEVPDDVREILLRRAERLREVPSADDAADSAQFWVAAFRVGDDTYAVPLEQMRACVALKAVTPVPLTGPHVVGVIRFEGQAITVFSVAALLGERGWSRDPSVLLVLEVAAGRLVGIDCEQIPTPLSLPLSRVITAQETAGPIKSVLVDGGQKLQLIDVARLLQDRKEDRR